MGRQRLCIISMFSTVEYVNPFRERQGMAQQVIVQHNSVRHTSIKAPGTAVCVSVAGGTDTDRHLEPSDTSHAVNSRFSGRSGLKK